MSKSKKIEKNVVLNWITSLGFILKNGTTEEIYEKYYPAVSSKPLVVNVSTETIEYENFGINADRITTFNFSQGENLVVLECIDRLLKKGYKPECLYLEKRFGIGVSGGGWLDILVLNENKNTYMMIECKEWDKYKTALKKLKSNDNNDGNNQLLSYFANDKNADVICLYTSRIKNGEVENDKDIIYTENLKQYNNATEIFKAWNKETTKLGIFEDNIEPYKCTDKKKRGNLLPLTEEISSTIFNDFLEILRRNGISDKPNAFNKILNLFLCKIVDEEKNADELLDFQWTQNTTYVSMQSTLDKLYQKGMKEYLNIEITDYSELAIRTKLETVIGDKHPDLVEEIVKQFTEIKYHKSSEFAFKEIYNEETFLDNAKVIKEIIKLLQNYQFRYAHKQQFLGVFFENLLATSIKQEVGQFFTPVPVARFMITSLPLQKALRDKAKNAINGKSVVNVIPTVIDYSCGSGHFLTEFMDLMQQVIDDCDTTVYNESVKKKLVNQQNSEFDWASECVYGIEKDYRLVKTTKISTFLNGDGEANIIHADGLTDFGKDKFDIGLLKKEGQFDFVIANPPYSVNNFKAELKNKNFTGYRYLTENSKEIECLFIERTAQLLKTGGYAAVILPTSVISNDGIYEDARQNIIKYFHIRAIVKMGKNTFMSTKVETVILFLEKRDITDYENTKIAVDKFFNDFKDINMGGNKKIVEEYAKKVGLSFEDYISILKGEPTKTAKESNYYLSIGGV